MSISPAYRTFKVYRGSSWRDSFVVIDQITGLPRDLTGLKLRMQVRPYIGSPTVLIELNTGNSRLLVSNGPGGVCSLDVTTPDVENAFPVNNHRKAVYVYDVELVNDTVSPEYVEPLLRGRVRVYPQVTR